MEQPRIYGSDDGFHRALARSIRSGENLLAQTDGIRKRMQLAGDQLNALLIEQEWERDFRHWFNGTGRTLVKYLQEQIVPPSTRQPPAEGKEFLPVLGAGLPPDTGKPRHTIHIDEGEEWLERTLDELRELQSLFPQSTKPPTKFPSKREASRPEGRIRALAGQHIPALLIAILGALIAAFIAFKLGWV